MVSEGQTLDCRGKLCPKPLLETKRAMASLESDSLTVLVDNMGARENVSRAMLEAGHDVLVEEADGEWTLVITKGATCAASEEAGAPAASLKTTVLVGDRGLGRPDPDLGAILMRAFMTTISELPEPPAEFVLMQGGVRLACEGSDCLGALSALEKAGVTILACGTCLDYFGLMDKLQVGRISNMAEIVDRLLTAERVVPL